MWCFPALRSRAPHKPLNEHHVRYLSDWPIAIELGRSKRPVIYFGNVALGAKSRLICAPQTLQTGFLVLVLTIIEARRKKNFRLDFLVVES